MADKTFGVKVSEDLHERVKSMIEVSGESSKEWFEKAVALTEMQSIKEGATEHKQDLNELEVHTTRIYELVANMVQRSIYIKDHAVKEIAGKLEQKEAIIGEYQEKANAAIEELKDAKEHLALLENDKEELTKQLENQQTTNENNQLLINEYKEKNDTLTGLVNKYQAYADENEKLKESYAIERKDLESQVNEVLGHNESLQVQVKEFEQQLRALEDKHNTELERLGEKKDYEMDKALLGLEREYQQKIVDANADYTDKLKEMYAEMDILRKEYEDKIEQLKQNDTSNKKE